MCRCDHDKNQLFISNVYLVLHNCKSVTQNFSGNSSQNLEKVLKIRLKSFAANE